MNLADFQRTFFDLMRQPLTVSGGQRTHTPDGQSVRAIAAALVTPGPRLTPFERLELYSQGYWSRILDALREDFPGLRALLGRAPFERLVTAYLADCPPDSFDLRRLGARLAQWLADHPDYAARHAPTALDMVRLESTELAARDAAAWPALFADELGQLGPDPCLLLQPHLRLLALAHPVDELLTAMRQRAEKRTAGAARPDVRVTVRRLPLPQPEPVHLAVHRHEGTVYLRRLAPEAFALLTALRQGRSLSEAIQESLVASIDDDSKDQIGSRLQQWFAEWSALGWFCRAPADE